MSINLLIVESPAKASTINKYLGKDFQVLASYGHVRDLVPKSGAIDTDADFAMNYQLIERNKKHVDKLIKAARAAENIYLATDLDREGEAIAWHVQEIFREKKLLDGKRKVFRVVFSEITKSAVQHAVANPRVLSDNLVDAQQARRALDYLVGFNLSPLLWKKLQPRLSAGRVQTPALRLIVEREEEIERFQAQEYWTIAANLHQHGMDFQAALVKWQGKKVEQFSFTGAEQAHAVQSALQVAAGGRLKVAEIKKRQRRRRPPPPYITSTMQQDASRKLRYSASRTMRLAQQLYEGINTDSGPQGLITYMRTDSVTLAGEAVAGLRAQISSQFGADKVPEKPNFYTTKSRNAQEAHEAIRPTNPAWTPERLKPYLKEDQYKLYALIWSRTMACQMIPAVMDTVTVEFSAAEDSRFRVSGSTIREPGFLSVYEEAPVGGKQAKEVRLPEMDVDEQVQLQAINADQHFTEPPPRYSEASLIKTLEEFGIGRPSTYASIISVLLDREYVVLDSRRFMPTDTGRVVANFLSSHFEQYVDYKFTARLEDELDAIARGEQPWLPVLRDFWQGFIHKINDIEKNVSRAEARQARDLGIDPKSGKPVSVRLGRYGPFAQIGDTEIEEEKPKFAGLLPGQQLGTITLEEALALFKLPRDLGETSDGEEVAANIGRFGPYLRYGKKFVSLPKEDDPYTVDLERALELIAAKQKADAERIIQVFEEQGIQILKGKYGPYITNGKKNLSVPKDCEPDSLTLAECIELLANAPEKRGRGKKASSKKTASKKASKKKASKKKSTRKKVGRKKTGKKKAGKKKSASKKTVSKATANDQSADKKVVNE
ncbi:MAG: type I DNA topoisomerase [Gammaproteobacteria bacterium]|jgi:DNA topoisomerase-1|nr:type I DNA topoisomerase [Gammaproteobacteria bacterium]